ncbi:hypothetical protein AB3S75_034214 [Citrus x aurantiifolia]
MANTISILVFATFLLHLTAASYSDVPSSQAATGQEVQSARVASAPRPEKRVLKGQHKIFKKRKASAAFAVIPGKKYCVPKENLSEVTLKEQIEWGCMQGVDCDPVVNMKEVSCADQSWYVKAAYVMNYYFNAHGRDEASCYFNNNAMLTYDNPSNATCPMF